MRFITIRDLRSCSARIQRELPKEKEMILTSNGKPIAILSAVTGDRLEESLAIIHRAKAIEAVNYLQEQSIKNGADRLTLEEINKEIASERKRRRSK